MPPNSMATISYSFCLCLCWEHFLRLALSFPTKSIKRAKRRCKRGGKGCRRGNRLESGREKSLKDLDQGAQVPATGKKNPKAKIINKTFH